MSDRQLDQVEEATVRDARPDSPRPNGNGSRPEASPGDVESSWMQRMRAINEATASSGGEYETPKAHFEFAEVEAPGHGGQTGDTTEAEVERLREEARRLAYADARKGVPAASGDGPTESEVELRGRCAAFFERWHSRERRKLNREVGEREERIAETLSKVEMGIDRFQRSINETIRLRARFAMRRREVTEELGSEGRERGRGLPTGVYLGALFFLGLVEFFANAPVFSSLLPRDPLTETQIQVLTETATGWLAGLERVGAHIIFRPDAALLAAGVITFLCVLGHFFGHSLRDLVMQGERKERRHTLHSRSVKENIVPIVLSGVGLVLTLGVLYQARMQLGEVGAERYTTDMAQVEELRRQAGWLRVDGDILQANQLTNQADDMEEAATDLREYSLSMSRMNFPIMLLNLTLVLCAISAAYFHRRDAIREQFNESPFEDERRILLDQAEVAANETSEFLALLAKDLRALKTLVVHGAAGEARSMVHHLESVIATYRAEHGRAWRMAGPSPVIAGTFTGLDLDVGSQSEQRLTLREPEEYEAERADLASRFRALRDQFNEESAATW